MILCPAHHLPVRHDKECFRVYRRELAKKHNLVAPSRYDNVWIELAIKPWRVEEE